MTYSLNEIIDIAIGMEENGYAFYKECAAFFSNAKIQEVFSFLAQEELSHKMIFQSMKDSAVRGNYTEEYYSYLRSISARTFAVSGPDLKNRMANIHSPEDAIHKGFMDEKDSILFYNELKDPYKEDDKTILLLDQIIAEERKHVKLLLDLEKMYLTNS